MSNDVVGPQRTARVAALKGFGLGAVVVALFAVAAFAAFREAAPPQQSRTAAVGVPMGGERPALTAAEEKYAHELWEVHARVKQSAVKMTFAGLAYKMGDIPRKALKERVGPLVPAFEAALAHANRLQPPQVAGALHRQYTEAIGLYRDASAMMVRAAAEDNDDGLVQAQQLSDRAAGLSLKVGDSLWPGEYKPN